MPRANRYLMAGYVYHLTHRCQNREFLLRHRRDRNIYREWLRQGARRYQVPIFGYMVTCNHVHIIAHAVDTERVAQMMQLAAGATARQYNRREGRTGPFWEDQYHATIIESGRHLWNCLCYVDLNMVRAQATRHPARWSWCGYHELMGTRKRYRLLDANGLLKHLDGPRIEDFRKSYQDSLTTRLAQPVQEREPAWSEALAIGSESFIERLKLAYTKRQKLETVALDRGSAPADWMLREASCPYHAQ